MSLNNKRQKVDKYLITPYTTRASPNDYTKK